MNGFIIVIKKDPQVQIKMKDMLDKYNRLPYSYQSKIGYDTLIHYVILKKMINLMPTTTVDIDVELKMKISRIDYLESKKNIIENIIIKMEECNICPTKIKKRNKNKHEQSKKHENFSNLIISKYIVRNPEVDKLKDIIQPYCNDHKKEFDTLSVCVMWKKNDVLINKISVPSTFTLEKPHLLKSSMIELSIVVQVSPLDFLDTFERNINNEVDEIKINFISDRKDITFFHYMGQPKSMLCRKLV